MRLMLQVMTVWTALLASACVGYAPRTCESQGYAKDSSEYQACIKNKQQQNYYRGSGIGGGGP